MTERPRLNKQQLSLNSLLHFIHRSPGTIQKRTRDSSTNKSNRGSYSQHAGAKVLCVLFSHCRAAFTSRAVVVMRKGSCERPATLITPRLTRSSSSPTLARLVLIAPAATTKPFDINFIITTILTYSPAKPMITVAVNLVADFAVSHSL